MRKIFFRVLVLGFCLSGLNALWAQQNYPVKISGSLIKPNSLVLSDYANSRANDISFVMTLQDPIEPSRPVRLRLTVLNEGNPVLVTNPNYLPPPIVLTSHIPQILTGVDLAGYLNTANLSPVNGSGQASDLLPTGYNSICIEAIDVQRNIPISTRYCLNGYFDLAQPPILNLPACGAILPFQTAANITFSWTPMHQLSANRPTDVSYEFTLVKLLPGVSDPNDGFSQSPVVLKRTVMQPIFRYLQDDPVLEQDGLYAWRVRAIDGRGLDLFINHGYSQVCTFAFENGGQLGQHLLTCNGPDCSYTDPISTSPLNDPLTINDQIALGFFTMKLTTVSMVSPGVFSGSGTIYIPYLFSKLQVDFDNIRVNKDRRMYDGVVNATVQNTALIPPLFSATNQMALVNAAGSMAVGFADQTAKDLNDYFNGGGTPNLVSTLKSVAEENAVPIGLPIGMDQQVPGTSIKTTVAVVGIQFLPTEAHLNAVLGAQFSPQGSWFKFGIKGLCVQPHGLGASAPKLLLLNDVSITETGVPLTFRGISANGDPGTYVSWNCEGFEQFVLSGSYEFSRDYIRPKANPAGSISANFTLTTKRLDDFILKVDPTEDFFVTGAQDFPFHVGELWLDCSKTQNPPGLVFPPNYPPAHADSTFRGVFITQAGVALPPVFQQSAGGALPSLTGTGILFDQHGLTGRITGKNLISLSTGDLGGWGYSLDSAWLSIQANSFLGSGFSGKMRLPIMRDQEALKYRGAFFPGIDAQGKPTGMMDFAFRAAPDSVTIDLLKARIVFDTSSQIRVDRVNGQFLSPKALLSGVLKSAATPNDPGFAGNIMQEIQAFQTTLSQMGLGVLVPKFSIDGIRFDSMKIDMSAADKFQIARIVPQNASFSFLGVNADLSNLNFATLTAADFTELKLPPIPGGLAKAMRFKFDVAKDVLGALAPTVFFDLVIKEEQTAANKTKYSFGSFDFRFKAPEVAFGCDKNIPSIVLDKSPANFAGAPIQGNLKAGHFTLKPDYPLLSDNGSGRISGTGTIDVDILGPFRTLSVTFTDVQVDRSGRIVDGEVITGGDSGLFNSPDLTGVLSTVQGQVDNMMAGLNSQFSLPVVIGKKASGENERDQGLILMGLVFAPDKATARAKVIFDPGNGRPIEFVADGLTIVPNGIASFDIAVGLAADYPFQPIDGINPLVFKKYNPADTSGSYIKLDCRGFLEFNMAASYSFSKDMLVSLDHPNDPVTGTFVFNSKKWGEFIAKLTGVGRFTFPGLDGFEMSVSDAYVDFSKVRNVDNFKIPEDYNDPGLLWRGFYMPNLTIKLPPEFALSSSGRTPTITCANMLIDNQGLSFSLFGLNLMDGAVGGWNFALDSMGLTVVSNTLTNGAVSGKINVPLMEEPMGYLGSFSKDQNGFWALRLRPTNNTRFQLSALHAYLDLTTSSEIVLGSVPYPLPNNPSNRKFKPYANLYGTIGVDLKRSDFPSELETAIGFIEKIIGQPFDFKPPAISLYGLKINHPDLPAGKKFGLDTFEIIGSLSLGGHELQFKDMRLKDLPLVLNNQTFEGINLQFDVDLSPLKFSLGIWGKKDPVTGKYGFGKLTLDVNLPKLSCKPNPNSKFTIAGGSSKVDVPFLSATYNIAPVAGTSNYTTNGMNAAVFPFSLAAKLKSLGSELPFDLKLPSMDSDDLQNLDFSILGITFNGTTGAAFLNAELTFRVRGTDVSFIASLPIHPDGISFDEIRVGPGKDY